MFTIGADPELFLKDNNGKFISGVGIIPGTKEEPFPIDQQGHAIQLDNVAAEFCIPPAKNKYDFSRSISETLIHLEKRAREVNLKLAEKCSAANFDEDQLQTWQAVTFGCDPDYNAWTKKQNPKPSCDNPNLRSAGGHVHVGVTYDDGTPIPAHEIARAMDLFLGVPSLDRDKDTLRRKLYGKAGAFRPKPYGAEYRTLGNWWIWDRNTVLWVYEQTEKAVKFLQAKQTVSPRLGKYIQAAINEEDKNAKAICLEVLANGEF